VFKGDLNYRWAARHCAAVLARCLQAPLHCMSTTAFAVQGRPQQQVRAAALCICVVNAICLQRLPRMVIALQLSRLAVGQVVTTAMLAGRGLKPQWP
jgi:hypothetical protein